MTWDLFQILRAAGFSRSRARQRCKRKQGPGAHYVSLEVTPLEDRTLLSNVLSYLSPDLTETVLTPANVTPTTFGLKFSVALNGFSRAQALYDSGVVIPAGAPYAGTHNVVYVATENDVLYAIDANSDTVLWQDTLLNAPAGGIPVPGTDFGDNTANFGIRGTPVIDASTGTIFVVTFARQNAGANYDYLYQLWDINLATGANAIAPVTIGEASEPVSATNATAQGANWVADWAIISGPAVQGTGVASVNGTIQFNAAAEVETAALTLDPVNGDVYICFAGLIETTSDEFHGWILGYNTETLQLNAVWNDTPAGSEGGIWLAGGAMAVDAQGDLYVATGNGDFSNTENGVPGPVLNAAGFPPDGNYGDSIVKLVPTSSSAVNVNGYGLNAVDYFTPQDQEYLDDTDGDIASPCILLPNPDGTAADPDLLEGAGKDQNDYVVDPDNMGKYNANQNNVVQQIPINIPADQENQLAAAAFFNGTLYTTGNDQPAAAYSLLDNQLTLTSQSSNVFGFGGADPTISANGTSNGIVWELDFGTNQLFAYNASNLADELWASGTSGANFLTSHMYEFNAPTVANGMVYVASGFGLYAYGLLDTTPSAPAGLTTTSVGSTQATLSWTNSTSTQTGVEIQRSLDGVNFTTITTVAAGISTYQDTSVVPNRTYFYQVVATNNGVVSAPSKEISLTTTAMAGTMPTAPSGLTAVAVAGAAGLPAQVNLSWTDSASDETGFLIERSVGGGSYALLQQVSASQTTYSDPNLSPGSYSYEVIAVNAAGNSSPVAASANPVVLPTVPATPSHAGVSFVSSIAINFSWQDNATNAQGVQILRRVGSIGDYALLATLPANATTYSDTGLTPGTVYEYQIEAFNISGHVNFAGVSATTQLVSANYFLADANTQGTWKGTYGADGYDLASGAASIPAYAVVNTDSTPTMAFTPPAGDPSVLENPNGAGVAASQWYGSFFNIDVTVTDGNLHEISLYFLDWNNAGISERVQLVNADTNAVLDTRTVSNFSGGEYLSWNIEGHVEFRFTTLAGPNAVLSGFFSETPTASAAVVDTDAVTQGSWEGAYGIDGYSLANVPASLPAYAQVSFPGNTPTWTWTASTADPRALQNPGGGRLAASWQSSSGVVGSNFSVDVDLTDGLFHTVSLYFLDWDSAGRFERVDVLDAGTGTLLNSQTISNFSGGTYLTWNLQGNIAFRVTLLHGTNAVLSGLFFGGATPAASLVSTNTTTGGNWQGSYGTDGYNVVGANASYPAYAQVTPIGTSTFVWAASTANTSALQNPSGTSGIAATWYSWPSFTVDVDILDGQVHTLSLYLLDWGNAGRSERIDVLNASTGATLATTTISQFSAGEYVTFTVRGDVQFVFTDLQGPNAVLSGLFFGGATPAASLISTGNTTGGNWQGSFGADGYNVIGTTPSYPTYAQVTPIGTGTYVWAASTTNPSALQNPNGGGGIAATWYGWPSFTVDVNLLDGQMHTLTLYLLDWANAGRSESIEVLNAGTGAVLSTTTVSNFSGGDYLTFTVQGNVQLVFTDLHGPNAVLSGLFFGGATPAASLISTNATTGGTWQASYGADGYNVVGATPSYPAYAQVTPIGTGTYVWASSTTTTSALQNPSGTGRIAATWFAWPSFSVDVDLLDGQVHTLSLYLLDWGNAGRSESIEVLNAGTGTVLVSPTTVSNFSGGEYLTFTVQGNVQFVFTDLHGPNPVLSGLFFGGAAPAATLGATDSTTKGNWQGVYGTAGYNVVGAGASYPANAQVTPVGTSTYVWASSTTSTRALENPSGTGRTAATWYAWPSFSVDINFTDSQVHMVSLYLLDWGNQGRSESIQVLNAGTGALLASTTASNFSGGEYVTFAVQGDVQLVFTDLAGPNAVLSGLFFE